MFVILFIYFNDNEINGINLNNLKLSKLDINIPDDFKALNYLKHSVFSNKKYDEFINELMKKYPDFATQFIKTFYKKSKSLNNIDTYSEIMVHCKEMYMINKENDDFADEINDILETFSNK